MIGVFGQAIQKQVIFTFLLAISISIQVFNANAYRQDWALQNKLYWQLAWRIPSLAPGTAIIGKGTFTDKSSYGDATYIINLLFDEQVKAQPNYYYYDIWHINPDQVNPNSTIIADVSEIRGRGMFVGNTSRAIAMFFDNTGGCVRLLDPVYTNDPQINQRLRDLIPISNLNLITRDTNRPTPDPAIFGSEPVHDWCYFFEKADLARQFSEWDTIVTMYSEVEMRGLKPVLGGEYLPFIEALAQTGDFSKAMALSRTVKQLDPELDPALCDTWKRLSVINDGQDQDIIASFLEAEQRFCGNPGE